MILVGFALMCILNAIRARRYAYKWWQGLLISLAVEIFAVIGARLMFIIENFESVIANGFSLWGGVSFFGTVLFLPLFMMALCLISKQSIARVLDFITPGVALELACIRVGCFFSGCCYGRPTNGSWGIAMWFDKQTLRIPTQLIECFFDLVIFIALLIYEKKINYKTGIMYPLFLISYGILRFIVEFFRENATLFTYAHVFSLMAIAVGGYFVYVFILKHRIAKKQ